MNRALPPGDRRSFESSPYFADAVALRRADVQDRPDVVGQPPAKVVFGKGSGIDSVKNGLKTLGVEFTEDEAMQVVSAVKEFSLQHKRLLTAAEFNSIVSKVLPAKAGAVSGNAI